MVTTYKNGRKARTSQIVFGKYGGESYTWSDKMVVECKSYSGDIVQWLKDFFTEMGVRGVDMSDFRLMITRPTTKQSVGASIRMFIFGLKLKNVKYVQCL